MQHPTPPPIAYGPSLPAPSEDHVDTPTSRAALPQPSGCVTLGSLWQRARFPLVSPGLPMGTVKAAYRRAPTSPQPPDPCPAQRNHGPRQAPRPQRARRRAAPSPLSRPSEPVLEALQPGYLSTSSCPPHSEPPGRTPQPTGTAPSSPTLALAPPFPPLPLARHLTSAPPTPRPAPRGSGWRQPGTGLTSAHQHAGP